MSCEDVCPGQYPVDGILTEGPCSLFILGHSLDEVAVPLPLRGLPQWTRTEQALRNPDLPSWLEFFTGSPCDAACYWLDPPLPRPSTCTLCRWSLLHTSLPWIRLTWLQDWSSPVYIKGLCTSGGAAACSCWLGLHQRSSGVGPTTS